MEQPTKKQKILDDFPPSDEFAKAQTYNINDEYTEKALEEIEAVVELVLEAAKSAASLKKNIFDFDVPKSMTGFTPIQWTRVIMIANYLLFPKNYYLEKYPRTTPRFCTFTIETFPKLSK